MALVSAFTFLSTFFAGRCYEAHICTILLLSVLIVNSSDHQVLAGDLEEAICTHALYYSIWRRYEAMPERFDWLQKAPVVSFYPLRPELVESTYLLYQVSHA